MTKLGLYRQFRRIVDERWGQLCRNDRLEGARMVRCFHDWQEDFWGEELYGDFLDWEARQGKRPRQGAKEQLRRFRTLELSASEVAEYERVFKDQILAEGDAPKVYTKPDLWEVLSHALTRSALLQVAPNRELVDSLEDELAEQFWGEDYSPRALEIYPENLPRIPVTAAEIETWRKRLQDEFLPALKGDKQGGK